jgi:hypothetical protein
MGVASGRSPRQSKGGASAGGGSAPPGPPYSTSGPSSPQDRRPMTAYAYGSSRTTD